MDVAKGWRVTVKVYMNPFRLRQPDMAKGGKKRKERKNSGKSEAPSLKQLVYDHFGIIGLVIFSAPILIVGVLGWYELWHNVQTLPLVHKIVCWRGDWLPKSALEKADPKRFSVALAHFETDKDESLEGDLKEALSNFDKTLGVQPLEFDRLICLQGHADDAAEALGKKKAHQYLAESGADILIWGVVRDENGKDVARVYLTTSNEFRRSPKPFVPLATDQAFDLPETLRSDISDVLSLAIAAQSAQFYQEGQYVADKLAPFIDKVRTLTQPNTALNGESLSRVKVVLANALGTVGEQSGNNGDLKGAIEEYQQAFAGINEGTSPLDWARTQNNLGATLKTLGSGSPELRAWMQRWRRFARRSRNGPVRRCRWTGR